MRRALRAHSRPIPNLGNTGGELIVEALGQTTIEEDNDEEKEEEEEEEDENEEGG